MVCKCDGKKPKQTEWAMIKHVERGMHKIISRPFTSAKRSDKDL
jgi:hypothetical protein